MSDYIGTVLLDRLLLEDSVPEESINDIYTYHSFFKDEECRRIIALDDIWIEHNDIFFRYLCTENDISFWGCQEADYCICVDETTKIFIQQPTSIIEERKLTGIEKESPMEEDCKNSAGEKE